MPFSWRLRLTFVAICLTLVSGCASIPKGTAAVNTVTVEGNDKISSADIEGKIATTESPKFLYLFRGVVYDYSLFDRSVLQRDLERVERFYRALGYYEAKARAGRVQYVDEKHVKVTIEVEEGQAVLVKEARIVGFDGGSKEDQDAVRASLHGFIKVGREFEEDRFNKAQKSMKRALTDRGYAWAKVEQHSDVDLPTHGAVVTFTVHVGPKAKFGKVTVQGLKLLPLKPVIRAINIEEGQPYSTNTIEFAQEAVIGLGTFNSVEIVPSLPEPPPADAVVPLTVKVREQKLKSILLGGGIELDAIRAETHLHVGWEDKNLFGGFRHFTVDFKPGFDLYPTRLPGFQKPTAVLPEEKLSASLRQPGFIEARTTGVITSELNAYPVLLTPKVDPTEPVIGFLEYKGSVGLERRFGKFFASPTYDFQYNLPFIYKGEKDPNLQGIVVSYVDALAHLDFRNDPIRPHSGVYIQNDFQFAGLGGDARDFRIQPEIRGYIPLGKKVTLAARATVGFLFPLNYGDAAKAQREGSGSVDTAALTKDDELIYLRGFFSGGPSSNRGYPLQGVGPHGPVPFYSPTLEAQQLASECDTNNKNYDEARCGVPLGGLSIWEASLELRFPIVDPLGAAVFCDTSDVSAKQVDIRLNYPHLSCGAGLRYDTPIGPVRVDVGYRIPGAQFPSSADPIQEGQASTIFGAPIAFAFGLGESF